MGAFSQGGSVYGGQHIFAGFAKAAIGGQHGEARTVCAGGVDEIFGGGDVGEGVGTVALVEEGGGQGDRLAGENGGRGNRQGLGIGAEGEVVGLAGDLGHVEEDGTVLGPEVARHAINAILAAEGGKEIAAGARGGAGFEGEGGDAQLAIGPIIG